MPELEVTSAARPSMFGYPAKLEDKKEKKQDKVETAVLSITAKQKKKKGEKDEDKMDTTVVSYRDGDPWWSLCL